MGEDLIIGGAETGVLAGWSLLERCGETAIECGLSSSFCDMGEASARVKDTAHVKVVKVAQRDSEWQTARCDLRCRQICERN